MSRRLPKTRRNSGIKAGMHVLTTPTLTSRQPQRMGVAIVPALFQLEVLSLWTIPKPEERDVDLQVSSVGSILRTRMRRMILAKQALKT